MPTKIAAVNDVLRRLGKLPVNALDSGGTSTHAHVERCIDDAVEAIQGEGWYWNTKYDVKVEPNSSNEIQVDNLELGKDAIYSVTNYTNANPAVITVRFTMGVETEPLKSGDYVFWTSQGSAGAITTQFTDRVFQVGGNATGASANGSDWDQQYELLGVDSSAFAAFTKSNYLRKVSRIIHADAEPTETKQYVKQGSKLYNLTDNTDTITSSVKIRYTYERAFEEIPEPFAELMIATAAFNFNRYYVGNNAGDAALQFEMNEARRRASREEIRAADVNVLDTVDMREIRGRRRTPNKGVY